MPLPLFFHLAIISWRKLELGEIAFYALPSLRQIPTYPALVPEAASVSPRRCVVFFCFFSPPSPHSAPEARGGCFHLVSG